jgi:hypothetical protein
MYFVFKYENRRMKPVKIVLRRGRSPRGRTKERVKLTKIYCSTYVNITMYFSIQILYANKTKPTKQKECTLQMGGLAGSGRGTALEMLGCQAFTEVCRHRHGQY